MQNPSGTLKCSLGVICYNEEDNIGSLLSALLNQNLDKACIAEIIVVSSACTDATDSIVLQFAAAHPHIRLISQAQREGKSAAINLFLAAASSSILIIESGDTIPAADSIEKLVSVFTDYKVGASGGRPVPVNPESNFIGYAVHLLWRLHHKMAQKSPKLGEIIAFRRVMDSIPSDSAVDEASIEAIIKTKRLRLKYVPDAIIHNKGPENWQDFIKQRRRIYNGHLWLSQTQAYKVASQDASILGSILLSELSERPRDAFKLLGVMLLETYCRVLGALDFYIKKKNPFKWDIAQSTKKLQN